MIPFRKLRRPWLRPIDTRLDLTDGENRPCDISGCLSVAQYVGGGWTGSGCDGWLLCEQHARKFSNRTDVKMPVGETEERT